MDLVLPAPVATTGTDGKTPDPDAQLRQLLRVSEFDPRPVLLYFHYPHEGVEKVSAEGAVSKKQCRSVSDEQVARWSALYRCFEVDMGVSDRTTAERLGAGTGTSWSVVDGKLSVLARSAARQNSKALVDFLRDGVQAAPDYWDAIQKRLEGQKQALAEARRLAAKKDWKAAKEKYDELRNSDLRIGDFWDDAFAEAVKAEAKANEK